MAAFEVTVSVTDTDVFDGVLKLLSEIHGSGDEELKERIEDRLVELLGTTHDIERMLHD